MKMFSRIPAVGLVIVVAALCSCTMISTARRWNGRYAEGGRKVFVKTVTKVGANAFVLLPFLGWSDNETLVDRLTEEIAREGGDNVRIIEFESRRYWWTSIVPFTMIVTPVVATVSAEYEPSAAELAKQEAAERNSWSERAKLASPPR